MIKNAHIYLNLFEHIGVKGNGNFGSPAIWLWDPENAVIERNAFNDILGDCIHLYSTNNGAFTEAFTSASDTIRWNFDANQNNRSGGGNDNGFSMMEVQAANGNSTLFQNVFYSQVAYTACAFSIAAGGAPCTTNSGGFSGCVPPSLNGGKSGIVIDGNIMLNNGINGPTPAGGVFGGVETMGVTPLVQNNWQRGWGSVSFTAYMFAYVAAALSGCVFDSKDATAQFTCRDGVCPGGRTCLAGTCVSLDGGIDARPLTCAAPGLATINDAGIVGTTLGAANQLDTRCDPVHAFAGPETVYQLVDLPIDHHLNVAFYSEGGMLSNSDQNLYAYLLDGCPIDRTPLCFGDEFASSSPLVPLEVTVTTPTLELVVDTIDPSVTGHYTVIVTTD